MTASDSAYQQEIKFQACWSSSAPVLGLAGFRSTLTEPPLRAWADLPNPSVTEPCPNYTRPHRSPAAAWKPALPPRSQPPGEAVQVVIPAPECGPQPAHGHASDALIDTICASSVCRGRNVLCLPALTNASIAAGLSWRSRQGGSGSKDDSPHASWSRLGLKQQRARSVTAPAGVLGGRKRERFTLDRPEPKRVEPSCAAQAGPELSGEYLRDWSGSGSAERSQ